MVVTDFLQASILMPFCMVLVITSLIKVGGIGGFVHSLPPQMKTIHMSGEFGWIYMVSWTIMVSFGYNTSAMAQRYFSVDNERSARKIALFCCRVVRRGRLSVVYSADGHADRISRLAQRMAGAEQLSEASYAVASLTLLPHGLIGMMIAAMFSATMANVGANFNVKSAILTKDIYQALFRKNAGDRELLVVGWMTTFLMGATPSPWQRSWLRPARACFRS